MTIAGVIANCNGWYEIDDFCRHREGWLRERMGLVLEHGIPLATTFAGVWEQIDSEAFEKCFTEWTGQMHKKIIGEVISIDGKTVRGSNDKDRQPLHMISA